MRSANLFLRAICIVLCFVGIAEAIMVHRSMALATRAIKVADDWENVAGEWKEAANRFEGVAMTAVAQTNTYADQFLVCNSMLPRAQRMQ